MANRQPFTRLPVPNASSDVQSAINDIYDKLAQVPHSVSVGVDPQIAQLQAQITALQKSKASAGGTAADGSAASVAALSIAGALGRAANPQYAFIPALASLPSTIPGVTPFAQDGLLLEQTPSPTTPGQLFRYDAASLSWVGFLSGGKNIVDTHAQRANHPAIAVEIGSTYTETDRQAYYYANGTDWVLITGLGRGTLANRYADLTALDVGFVWCTTDTNILYYWNGTKWAYLVGEQNLTLAAWGALTFAAEDAGYIVNITDYEHRIQWSGTTWSLMAGDSGSKYIVASADGSAPDGGVWQLCDGTVVTVLSIVAGVPTAVNVTTPDLTGDTFLRGGTFTGAVDPTSAPTFSSSGFTFSGTPDTLTGTVDAPVFTGAALGTHSHAVPVGTGSGTIVISNIFGSSGSVTAAAQATATAGGGSFAPLNSSSVSGGTPSGTNSAPNLTMDSYTPAGTISGSGTVSAPIVGTGAPKSYALLWYMRR